MASNYDININIDIESANLGELEKEFGRLNEEIKKIPRNSAAFNTAAANIKKVSGEVEKTNQKLQKIDVGQLVGDFAKVGAAIGAASLVFQQFGEEGDASNEALQKTLERTQAILGLVAVAEGAVSAARLVGKAALQAYTIAQNLANKAIESGSISLKGLKTALISTGIGAFVVLLGAVIANFDKIKDFFTGGSTGRYEKDVANLNKEQEKYNSNLAQQLAFSDRLRAEGEDEIKNLEYKIEVQKAYAEEYRVSSEKVLASLREIKLEEGSLTAEQIKQQNEIFAQREANNKAIVDLENQKNQELLKRNQAQSQREIALAQAKGEDTYQLEKKALEDRLALLKTYGDFFVNEVAETEAQITLLEEQERKKRADAAKAAAKERRDRIKGELNEIAQIIQQDPQKALELLADEEERALAILQKYSKGSKDITIIIKELEKQGLTPLANQFKNLTDASNFEDFQKLIQKYYGEQTKATIDSLSESFINFESQFPSINQTLAKFSRTFDQFESTSVFAVEQPGGRFAIGKGISSIATDVEQAIGILNTAANELRGEIRDNQKLLVNELGKLLNAGIITPEEFQKRINELTAAATERSVQITEETNSAIAQVLEASFQKTSIASTRLITEAEKNVANLETRFVGFSNFSELWSDDIVREQLKAQKALIDAQDVALNEQKTNLQTLYDRGIITETELTQGLDALDKQLFDNQIARQKLLNEERQRGLEEALEVYQQLDAAGQAYLDLIQSQIDLENVTYDAQIKAREDKLAKDLENEQLTVEQRTALEEKAAADVLNIEKQKAQAIAELQIKQAKLKYKLDVASIIINQSLAIVKAFADLGPIAGAIAAGLIGASTGFQLAAARNARDAAIASAESSASGFSSGGLAGGPTDTRQQFADGGYVSGPGTSRSDSIPARLSNGEFVVNAASTARFLPLLQQINSVPKQMANGGMASNGPDLTDVLLRIEKRLATPPKAYVVTSEIRDGLNTEEYLQRRATLT